jgi:hypothetical protein
VNGLDWLVDVRNEQFGVFLQQQTDADGRDACDDPVISADRPKIAALERRRFHPRMISNLTTLAAAGLAVPMTPAVTMMALSKARMAFSQSLPGVVPP